MMQLEPTIEKRILSDAHSAYPNEGCGFLFGEDRDSIRFIYDFYPVKNAQEGDQRKLFQISPVDYLKAERYADENHVQLLGIYHSHPNAPAIPSEYDRRAAQPFFSYLIVSLPEEGDPHIRSWLLNEEEKFEEEKLLHSQQLHESIS